MHQISRKLSRIPYLSGFISSPAPPFSEYTFVGQYIHTGYAYIIIHEHVFLFFKWIRNIVFFLILLFISVVPGLSCSRQAP